MVREPQKLRYKGRVPHVLHAIRRVSAKANVQQEIQQPEIYSCVYTLQAAVYTRTAVTKIILFGFPSFRFCTAGLFSNHSLTLLFLKVYLFTFTMYVD